MLIPFVCVFHGGINTEWVSESGTRVWRWVGRWWMVVLYMGAMSAGCVVDGIVHVLLMRNLFDLRILFAYCLQASNCIVSMTGIYEMWVADGVSRHSHFPSTNCRRRTTLVRL